MIFCFEKRNILLFQKDGNRDILSRIVIFCCHSLGTSKMIHAPGYDFQTDSRQDEGNLRKMKMMVILEDLIVKIFPSTHRSEKIGFENRLI